MKIIKPSNFMRAPSPLDLSKARRDSMVFTNMLIDTDPPRGRPVWGGGAEALRAVAQKER
jgi:hypothetical protein